jgi:hypothetical protein
MQLTGPGCPVGCSAQIRRAAGGQPEPVADLVFVRPTARRVKSYTSRSFVRITSQLQIGRCRVRAHRRLSRPRQGQHSAASELRDCLRSAGQSSC